MAEIIIFAAKVENNIQKMRHQALSLCIIMLSRVKKCKGAILSLYRAL